MPLSKSGPAHSFPFGNTSSSTTPASKGKKSKVKLGPAFAKASSAEIKAKEISQKKEIFKK